ncbi:MAG: hypothetical protein ACYC7E_00725 [Armatimonadota bacterium]
MAQVMKISWGEEGYRYADETDDAEKPAAQGIDDNTDAGVTERPGKRKGKHAVFGKKGGKQKNEATDAGERCENLTVRATPADPTDKDGQPKEKGGSQPGSEAARKVNIKHFKHQPEFQQSWNG